MPADSAGGRRGSGAPLLAAAGVLWGGAGAAGRMLAQAGQLSSWQVATGRALLGGCILVLAGWLLRRPWLSGRRAWRHVGLMALLTIAYQACYFAAVAAGSLSLATLVTLGSAPVFVTVVHAVQHRRLTRGAVGVLALALTGLGLLVGRPDAGASAPTVVVLAVGAGAAFAAMTMANAGGVPGADHITGTGVAFVLAGLSLAVVTTLLPGPALHLTPAVVGWLAVLGIACTAAPYALYFGGLLTTAAPVAAVFALLEPLTGTLIAITVFGETLGVLGWIGAALLLAAVVVSALMPAEGHRPRLTPSSTPSQ